MGPFRIGVCWAPCIIALVFPLAVTAAHAASPRAYCAQAVNDDQLRPAPSSLAGAIKHLFNLRGAEALQTTFYRCAEGKVMLCNVGANLPCGKANLSRVSTARRPGARTIRIRISSPWSQRAMTRSTIGVASTASRLPARRSRRSICAASSATIGSRSSEDRHDRDFRLSQTLRKMDLRNRRDRMSILGSIVSDDFRSLVALPLRLRRQQRLAAPIRLGSADASGCAELARQLSGSAPQRQRRPPSMSMPC